MFGLGPMELAVIGVVAVLLFGRKLPEVGRSLGKTIVEIKRGMSGLETGFDEAPAAAPMARNEPAPSEAIRAPQRVAPTAPKFDDTGV